MASPPLRWSTCGPVHALDRTGISENDDDLSDDWADFDDPEVAQSVIHDAQPLDSAPSSDRIKAEDREERSLTAASRSTAASDAVEEGIPSSSSGRDEATLSITTAEPGSRTPSSSFENGGDEATDMALVWRMGLGGIVALAGLAGLGFLGHKTWKSQAPKVQKAMEARQLARESQQRLGEFMSELRNQSTADISAKNLGDEGTMMLNVHF